ncbi:MAG: rod shape-determining protein MreD [Chloroflexi bacterium]|nr:rod shape-determining protein MreD [Chloroflexota bacterium]
MRLVIALGLLLLAALVQSQIGPALPLLGGRPDLPLVFVLAWAVQRGANEGAIVGFIAGLLLDSVGYTPFGLNAALLGSAGYVTGLPEANVYRGNVPFFVGVAVLITLAYHTLMFLALQAYGLQLPPVSEAFSLALWAAVMNALLLAPAYLLVRRLLRAMDGWTQLRL